MRFSRPIAVLPLAMAFGCMPTGSFKITALPRDLTLQEETVYRESMWTGNRVAILDVSGILLNNKELGFLSEGEHPVSFLVEKLTAAAEDSRVKAVVLRINSPGGSVTASDTLYQEVMAFKKKTHKPVIAFFQDVAASGAYYTACAADVIMAQRTSVTGSIGVVMQMFDASETLRKIGVSPDAIISGKFKDSGSPLRTMREDERKLFQDLVNNFYGQFVEVVAAGRPKLTREQVTTLADGRVYSANQALENGLIDRIGTLQDAIAEAKARANVNVANAVLYHRPLEWSPNIYSTAPPAPAARVVNLFNVSIPSFWTKYPRFMYIWLSEG